MRCVVVLELAVYEPAQLRTQSEAASLPPTEHPALECMIEGSKASSYCGPADVPSGSLICLGLQNLTMPSDPYIQGLRRLSSRLRLLGWVRLAVRFAFLRCGCNCLVRSAARRLLLLLMFCPSSDAVPPTLLCQGDGRLRTLAFCTKPHPGLPARLSQHLAS